MWDSYQLINEGICFLVLSLLADVCFVGLSVWPISEFFGLLLLQLMLVVYLVLSVFFLGVCLGYPSLIHTSFTIQPRTKKEKRKKEGFLFPKERIPSREGNNQRKPIYRGFRVTLHTSMTSITESKITPKGRRGVLQFSNQRKLLIEGIEKMKCSIMDSGAIRFNTVIVLFKSSLINVDPISVMLIVDSTNTLQHADIFQKGGKKPAINPCHWKKFTSKTHPPQPHLSDQQDKQIVRVFVYLK